MKIAVPVVDGNLTLHFGHCQGFDVFDVDNDKKEVVKKEFYTAPPHEPGVLPKFLGDLKTTHIIAGGMGRRAKDLFSAQGIEVIVGANAMPSVQVVESYLSGNLELGTNACDH